MNKLFPRIATCIICLCASIEINCMVDSQSPNRTIALTNTGKTAFIAHMIYAAGTIKTTLEPHSTWSVKGFKMPKEITLEVTEGSRKFTASFKPDKELSEIKISESPQDKSLCAIVNGTDAILLIEKYRPQSAPANSFRHHQ